MSILNLFYGRSTEHEAAVYFQLPEPPLPELKLTGEVVGPYCSSGDTLTARFAIGDLGLGETQLAKASITDPCFWSPDAPNLYKANIQLERQGETVESWQRDFGIRRLGFRKQNLWLEDRRIVLRIADHALAPRATLSEWKAQRMTMLTRQPGDELCRQAAEEGLFLLIDLATAPDAAGQARYWSHYAAVLGVLVPPEANPQEIRASAPNLLIGQAQPGETTAVDFLVVDDSVSPPSTPFFVREFVATPCNLNELRARCDALQKRIAATSLASRFSGLMLTK